MRVMGLDIGDRTVGVAFSDGGGTIAQGFCVIRRTTPRRDLAEVVALAASHGASSIVAGLPRRLQGDLGPQADKVLVFVDALREAAPIPVELWDERLTTRIAVAALRDGNVPRARRRALVDQVAATVILQGFLDARAARRQRGAQGEASAEATVGAALPEDGASRFPAADRQTGAGAAGGSHGTT